MKTVEVTLLSVNIGRGRRLERGGRKVTTGIFKDPVSGSADISVEGVSGDTISDKAHHGGPDQAVYLYSAEDALWWAGKLNREVPAGFFGENLTLDRWWPGLRVGDRLQSGPLVLEITFPRIPCATLAARVGDPGFLKAFVEGKRPGAYARVLSAGPARAGDRFSVTAAPQKYATIEALFDLWHSGTRDPNFMRRALESPVAARARAALEHWLTQEVI